MRLAFWRAGKYKAVIERAVSKSKADSRPNVEARVEAKAEAKPAPAVTQPSPVESGDIDLHALGGALARKRSWIIVPTVQVFAVSSRKFALPPL